MIQTEEAVVGKVVRLSEKFEEVVPEVFLE